MFNVKESTVVKFQRETTTVELMICLTEIAETGNAETQPLRILNYAKENGLIEICNISTRRPLRITDKGCVFYAENLIFTHSPLYNFLNALN
jgi:hypothetical protein